MSATETTAEQENLSKKQTETLETLPFEYQWPQDNIGEYYLMERHVCEYLKEDSLLQKYPEIQYHEVIKEERKFLSEQGAITEAEFHNADKKVQAGFCGECCGRRKKFRPNYGSEVSVYRHSRRLF
jgi:hypothetical protein